MGCWCTGTRARDTSTQVGEYAFAGRRQPWSWGWRVLPTFYPPCSSTSIRWSTMRKGEYPVLYVVEMSP
jgi:hypothetical protein